MTWNCFDSMLQFVQSGPRGILQEARKKSVWPEFVWTGNSKDWILNREVLWRKQADKGGESWQRHSTIQCLDTTVHETCQNLVVRNQCKQIPWLLELISHNARWFVWNCFTYSPSTSPTQLWEGEKKQHTHTQTHTPDVEVWHLGTTISYSLTSEARGCYDPPHHPTSTFSWVESAHSALRSFK